MKQAIILSLTLIALFVFEATSMAEHETEKPAVLNMSDDEQIALARSAAPSFISNDANIFIVNWNGKFKKVRAGTNGFTCYSDLDKIDAPVPSCMDAAAVQWWDDFVSGKPGPTNTVPGIAYMAQGALRWEKDGKIYMDWHTPGTKRVKEPPHWLVLWPIDPKINKLPTYPGKFGSYIMYDGTPWSHLMIYQDPMLMGK
ncbi:MAG TPA: hypothetical protein ENG88_01650 [Nitrospirae bacterium]|nr:hypothetical protein [Nitrospirota bacterium]